MAETSLHTPPSCLWPKPYEGLTSVAELGASPAWRDFTRTTLQLHLAQLPLLNRNLEILANCFVTLKELRHLTLDLSHCEGLTSVAELGEGLAQLQQLTQLTLRACSSSRSSP
eukprot:TRINITY_DN16277_c0_g1_i8.p2 TRINITY_DN16277_c0_g1~~TRINITY_DN16277_c0_g1_i8.p2  ORF type:complete len:113 (-),score=32.89 TRINITY_DN16277_c0_g1_i8:98-436(-)